MATMPSISVTTATTWESMTFSFGYPLASAAAKGEGSGRLFQQQQIFCGRLAVVGRHFIAMAAFTQTQRRNAGGKVIA